MQPSFQKVSFFIIFVTFLGVSLTGCKPKEPALDIQAQKTGFAQTAFAQASQTAAAQPTPTETPTLAPATSTPTEVSTNTPLLTPSTPVKTGQPTSSGKDAANWLANDPPDNTKFAPGEAFVVTWTIENIGTSTWTENFSVQFSSGEQMEAPANVNLPYPVPPNKNVQVSVNFIAPESLGQKRTDWKLVNDHNVPFYDFYLVVEVAEPEE